jgi:hypothetical protein
LERHPWAVKLARSFYKDFKRVEEEFIMTSFSEVNAL